MSVSVPVSVAISWFVADCNVSVFCSVFESAVSCRVRCPCVHLLSFLFLELSYVWDSVSFLVSVSAIPASPLLCLVFVYVAVLFCFFIRRWRLAACIAMADSQSLGAECRKNSNRLWAVHASSQNVLQHAAVSKILCKVIFDKLRFRTGFYSARTVPVQCPYSARTVPVDSARKDFLM